MQVLTDLETRPSFELDQWRPIPNDHLPMAIHRLCLQEHEPKVLLNRIWDLNGTGHWATVFYMETHSEGELRFVPAFLVCHVEDERKTKILAFAADGVDTV